MKIAHFTQLTGKDRIIARLAAKARGNTIYGGAEALALAKRMDRRKVDLGDLLAEEIVSDVYSKSTGKRDKYFEGWECPECGQVYLGQEKALGCCAEMETDLI